MSSVAPTTEQKKENRVKRLPGWVVSQMHSLEMKQDDVARELGITQPSLSTRLNPKEYKKKRTKDPFSFGDMLILFNLFDTPVDEIGKLMRL